MNKLNRLITAFLGILAIIAPISRNESISNRNINQDTSYNGESEINKLYSSLSNDKIYPITFDDYFNIIQKDEIYILGFTEDDDLNQTSKTYFVDFKADAKNNAVQVNSNYDDKHSIKQSDLAEITQNSGITYNLNITGDSSGIGYYYNM